MALSRAMSQPKPHSAHTGLSGCHLMTGPYLITPSSLRLTPVRPVLLEEDRRFTDHQGDVRFPV
jgi:hypothetical protein